MEKKELKEGVVVLDTSLGYQSDSLFTGYCQFRYRESETTRVLVGPTNQKLHLKIVVGVYKTTVSRHHSDSKT